MIARTAPGWLTRTKTFPLGVSATVTDRTPGGIRRSSGIQTTRAATATVLRFPGPALTETDRSRRLNHASERGSDQVSDSIAPAGEP